MDYQPRPSRKVPTISIARVDSHPPDAVYIGRQMPQWAASPLHNPYRLASEEDRPAALSSYRTYLWQALKAESPTEQQRAMRDELDRLLALWQAQGALTLLCWCGEKDCHGDVIASALAYLQANRPVPPPPAPTLPSHLFDDEASLARVDAGLYVLERASEAPRTLLAGVDRVVVDGVSVRRSWHRGVLVGVTRED